MPSKEWTTDGDWATWTLSHVESVGGTLQLIDGQSLGTATSPVWEDTDWVHFALDTLSGTRPEGASLLVAFRSGTTLNECSGADWQGPIDLLRDGVLQVPLDEWYAQHPAEPNGKYVQFQIIFKRA
jgi:hypothetical protein